MKYKDLIFKITSSNSDDNAKKKKTEELKKESPVIYNAAKKSVATKDVLIGVMIGEETVLNKGIVASLNREVERTLTVLFNSPISDSFSFLSFDKTTLIAMLELFPDKNHHFVSEREDFEEVKELKKTKMNFSTIHASMDAKKDFVGKIDYLVTINIAKIEPSMEAKLKEKKVMIFPMNFRGTKELSQPEKFVVPDPSGWGYNSASGKWLKTWCNDGSHEIDSWSAPDDWNLEAEPEYKIL